MKHALQMLVLLALCSTGCVAMRNKGVMPEFPTGSDLANDGSKESQDKLKKRYRMTLMDGEVHIGKAVRARAGFTGKFHPDLVDYLSHDSEAVQVLPSQGARMGLLAINIALALCGAISMVTAIFVIGLIVAIPLLVVVIGLGIGGMIWEHNQVKQEEAAVEAYNQHLSKRIKKAGKHGASDVTAPPAEQGYMPSEPPVQQYVAPPPPPPVVAPPPPPPASPPPSTPPPTVRVLLPDSDPPPPPPGPAANNGVMERPPAQAETGEAAPRAAEEEEDSPSPRKHKGKGKTKKERSTKVKRSEGTHSQANGSRPTTLYATGGTLLGGALALLLPILASSGIVTSIWLWDVGSGGSPFAHGIPIWAGACSNVACGACVCMSATSATLCTSGAGLLTWAALRPSSNSDSAEDDAEDAQ